MGNQNNSNAQLEYAFDSVPLGARKNGSVIFLILAGDIPFLFIILWQERP